MNFIKECLAQIIMSFDSIKSRPKQKTKVKRKRRIKSEKKKFIQYTKKFVTIITMFACIWVTWSYVLATYALKVYGNFEPLTSLSQDVTNSIICVGLGYFAKSFVETYCEKKIEASQELKEDNEEIQKINEEVEM